MNRNLKQQSGLTLVSLMIGMLLSMLCILASLTLYKDLIHVAAEAKVDAAHDGQLAAAMLTLQKTILSAGFGIDNANANDIIVRRVAPTSMQPGTIELLWRFVLNGTTQCSGLLETSEVHDSRAYRTLKLRKVTSGCNSVTPLASLNWQDVATFGQWPVIGGLDTYITNNETLLDFSLAQGSCSPFGATVNELHLILTVSAPNSASLNGVTGIPDITYDYCLQNTYPTAT